MSRKRLGIRASGAWDLQASGVVRGAFAALEMACPNVLGANRSFCLARLERP